MVDKDGNITFDVQTGGRYFIALGNEVKAPVTLCGDANGDGDVNILDASAILRYVVYGSPINMNCADTNSDGIVNERDASAILKYVVGLVDTLPASVS